MNGEESFVEDCSVFAEIDPSGRYGRVMFLLQSKILTFRIPKRGFLILVSCCLCSTMKYLAKELQRQCNRIHLLSLSFFKQFTLFNKKINHFFIV